MDTSVKSIEKTVVEFETSLRKRGFGKCRFIELHPLQKTGSLKFQYDLIGLLLFGGVMVEGAFPNRSLVAFEEFHVPSDSNFELLAGEHGAKILYGIGLLNK